MMTGRNSTLVQAVLHRIFDSAAHIIVWEDTAIVPNVCADVRFRFDGFDLEKGRREGDMSLVDEIKRCIGGGNIAWGNKLRGYVQERARHLSLKAGRRTGKHKRLA